MNDVYTDGMNTYTNSTLITWGTLPDELQTYATNLRDYLNQAMSRASWPRTTPPLRPSATS